VEPHSAEIALHADYIAALRPRLPQKDKALAILQAFEYQGLPYDFDFDFATDNTLVCTEVVYKAYQPRMGMEKGLDIPLVSILGRPTLPPNNIVELFDSETLSAEPHFDFVAFLDGSEKTQAAFFADSKALRESWKRIKWDFLLE
jgi:hypothetical protein